MAFLDKLMFWKKNDDMGLGLEPGPKPDFGMGMDAPGMDRPRDMGLDLGQDKGPGIPGSFEEPARTPGFEQPSFMQQQQPPQQPFQTVQQPTQQPSQQAPNDYIVSKNIEVLSSKLDALRAGIESINQRLAHLERIASGEHEKRRNW